MQHEEVNELIQQKVEKIEDPNRRQFIDELLKFEQSNIDKEKFQYKEEIKDLIEEYSSREK